MKETAYLEHEFAELNKAWDLQDIELDFNANSVTCVFTVAEERNKTVLFKSILDIHYAPDFSDAPPRLFGDVKFEVLFAEGELKPDECLWVHGNNAYDDVLPLYRATFESGDFRLKIICREVEFYDS